MNSGDIITEKIKKKEQVVASREEYSRVYKSQEAPSTIKKKLPETPKRPPKK